MPRFAFETERAIGTSLLGLALAMTGATLAEEAPAAPGGRVWFVDQKAANADNHGPGSQDHPFRTIQAAAERAEPGDRVLVRAGTYRERVMPPRSGTEEAPIVYEAMPDERVEVKGSEPWTSPWTADGENPRIVSSPIDESWFAEIPNPYRLAIRIAPPGQAGDLARPLPEEERNQPWPRTLGQIFVRGEPLVQVESLPLLRSMEGSWIVSADGATLQVHLPGDLPPERLLPTLEWSVRNRIFAPYRRGLRHIHVRGFVFEHCANQGPFPQGGAVSPRTGSGWVIENNTIRFAKTVGLDVGSECWAVANLPETAEEDRRLMIRTAHSPAPSLIVRNNTISDNGLCGIAGWQSSNVRIYNNRIERNNRLSFSKADARWEEWGGIKLHHAYQTVIAANIVRFNEGAGIWLDNGYNHAHVTGNLVVGNRLAGIMMELGAGSVLIDHNIVAHTRSDGGFYDGIGIYAHDASGLTVAHNLLLGNAGAGVLQRTVSARAYGGKPVGTSDNQIVNNIFLNNEKGAISLPFENSVATGNHCDHNLFLGGGAFFRLNKYSRDTFAWEDVWTKLREAELLAEDETPTGPGVFRQLDLDAWRAATGWDRDSVAAAAKGWEILPYRMLLRLDVPEALLALACPPVPETTVDFQGFPREGNGTPGPFQNLASGKHELPLTPYRYQEPPPRREKTK